MIILVETSRDKVAKIMDAIRKSMDAGNWYDFVEVHPNAGDITPHKKFLEGVEK